MANCRDCQTGEPVQTLGVGSFPPNPFGLNDMAGNAAEWLEDCWNESYRGAPSDGSAWTSGQCSLRVLRGRRIFRHAVGVSEIGGAIPLRFRRAIFRQWFSRGAEAAVKFVRAHHRERRDTADHRHLDGHGQYASRGCDIRAGADLSDPNITVHFSFYDMRRARSWTSRSAAAD